MFKKNLLWLSGLIGHNTTGIICPLFHINFCSNSDSPTPENPTIWKPYHLIIDPVSRGGRLTGVVLPQYLQNNERWVQSSKIKTNKHIVLLRTVFYDFWILFIMKCCSFLRHHLELLTWKIEHGLTMYV